MTAETEAAANSRTLVFLTAPLRGALKSFNTADTADHHNVKGPLPTAGGCFLEMVRGATFLVNFVSTLKLGTGGLQTGGLTRLIH